MSILLILTLILSISFIGVYATNTDTNVNSLTFSLPFPEVLNRAIMCNILYMGGLYDNYKNHTLNNFLYETLDNGNGLYYSAKFSTANVIVEVSTNLNIIIGNRDFWKKVIDDGSVDINIWTGFLNAILNLFFATRPEIRADMQSYINNASSSFIEAYDSIAIKNKINNMTRKDDFLAVILPCKATFTYIGFIPMTQDSIKRAVLVSWYDSIPDIPDGIVAPDWVYN